MKSKLIVMVGIQGSGKSTQAKELAKKHKQVWGHTGGSYSDWGGQVITELDAPIISSDAIRKEYSEWSNSQVFEHLYKEVNRHLKNGAETVILDATNISLKSRQQIFEKVKEPCEKIVYIMNTPYEECVERVRLRNEQLTEHHVPLEVVEKYWKSFQCPAKFEGWDEIILHNDFTEDGINSIKYIEIYDQMLKFNQENPNHNHTLGIHSSRVWEALQECLGVDEDTIEEMSGETLNLVNGTDLHDVGKLFTKVPNKNDPSYSSYYSHAEVGGYWKICNGFTPEEVKYETYHMHPYQWKTDKSHEKWRKIFGEEMYNNLLLLNKYDKEAH